jgi:hypothetical protein
VVEGALGNVEGLAVNTVAVGGDGSHCAVWLSKLMNVTTESPPR